MSEGKEGGRREEGGREEGERSYRMALPHRTKYSLNALSHDSAISLIRKVLADGVKLSEVTHPPLIV